MKKTIQLAIIACSAALLTACGGPSIDGKNEETFKKSLSELKTSLSREESKQFGQDMQVISTQFMSGMTLSNIQEKGEELMDTLDGKDASDIHDMAEDIRKSKKG